MELTHYFRLLARYWRSVLACTLLAVATMATFTWLQQPKYTSTASLFVAVDSGASAGELSQGATYAERQVKSYVEVGASAAVLQPVITDSNLKISVEKFTNRVKVTSKAGTSVIQVSVTDENPGRSVELTNAVANSLVTTIGQLAPPGPDGIHLVKATLVNPAAPPSAPSSPKPLLNLAIGVTVGLLLGAGQALLRHTLDTRIRTAADLDELTDIPVLATIGRTGDKLPDAGYATQDEAYRQLRTSIGFLSLGGERRCSLVISSAQAGEGKTETACKLAKVLAATGESVLLIDADLRRHQVAARLGIDGDIGLSDVLCGKLALSEALTVSATGTLDVLPGGSSPPNPSELLGSKAMHQLLEWAESRYKHVIIDAPPLLPVTDAVVLAGEVGGVLVIARYGQTNRHELTTALSILEVGASKALGVVLNDVPRKAQGNYSPYYYSARRQNPTADSSVTAHAPSSRQSSNAMESTPG